MPSPSHCKPSDMEISPETAQLITDTAGHARFDRKPKAPEPLLNASVLEAKLLAMAEDARQREASNPVMNGNDTRELDDRRQTLRKNSNVPDKYQGATLRGPINRRLPDACQTLTRDLASYLRTQRGAIVALLGPRGVGKTHLACGAILDACNDGFQGRYLDAGDYFDLMKGCFNGLARVNDIERQFSRLPLLAIDELHERGDTPWEDRTLARLIRKRHDNMVTTLLLSNQTLATFQERIGESVASRIKDGGKVLLCNWESLRGKQW